MARYTKNEARTPDEAKDRTVGLLARSAVAAGILALALAPTAALAAGAQQGQGPQGQAGRPQMARPANGEQPPALPDGQQPVEGEQPPALPGGETPDGIHKPGLPPHDMAHNPKLGIEPMTE